MDLVRFITAGSVDDGKSTLIGRLLYDTDSVPQDQLEIIQSHKTSEGGVNLALLTDGLKAEREQGITIDVAYKYFSTENRKYIIIDAPGHIQYTRNMVTGASNADVALVLIDARKGVVEQTYRHTWLLSLLGIRHIYACVNKMDLVGYSPEIYDSIQEHLNSFVESLSIPDFRVIPISALEGENIVRSSEHMTWYSGPTLFELLESVNLLQEVESSHGRLPVQYVIRVQNDEFQDYRAYAGQIQRGSFESGDEVVVLPSGYKSRIESIESNFGSVQDAHFPQSVSLRLSDEIDISRGDMIAKISSQQPQVSKLITADLAWMSEGPLHTGGKYLLQCCTRRTKAIVRELIEKVNLENQSWESVDSNLEMNDIARVKIQTAQPISFDLYAENRFTGSFILIDEKTNSTVAAGMIRGYEND